MEKIEPRLYFFCIKVSIITEKIKILKNFGYLFGSINSIN